MFQAAIALGAARPDADGVAAALGSITVKTSADRWSRAALFSSLGGRELSYLNEIKGRGPIAPELYNELGRLLGAGHLKRGMACAPQASLRRGTRIHVRARCAGRDPDRLRRVDARSPRDARARRGSCSALVTSDDANSSLTRNLKQLLAEMSKIALDASATLERRRIAVGLLAFAGFDEGGESLLKLVDPQQPSALQSAAVRALGAHRDPRVATVLLAAERFAAYTPGLRDEVLSAILSCSTTASPPSSLRSRRAGSRRSRSMPSGAGSSRKAATPRSRNGRPLSSAPSRATAPRCTTITRPSLTGNERPHQGARSLQAGVRLVPPARPRRRGGRPRPLRHSEPAQGVDPAPYPCPRPRDHAGLLRLHRRHQGWPRPHRPDLVRVTPRRTSPTCAQPLGKEDTHPPRPISTTSSPASNR